MGGKREFPKLFDFLKKHTNSFQEKKLFLTSQCDKTASLRKVPHCNHRITIQKMNAFFFLDMIEKPSGSMFTLREICSKLFVTNMFSATVS